MFSKKSKYPNCPLECDCDIDGTVQGYPGSRRYDNGEPVMCETTGLPDDYKENNDVGAEGISCYPPG